MSPFSDIDIPRTTMWPQRGSFIFFSTLTSSFYLTIKKFTFIRRASFLWIKHIPPVQQWNSQSNKLGKLCRTAIRDKILPLLDRVQAGVSSVLFPHPLRTEPVVQQLAHDHEAEKNRQFHSERRGWEKVVGVSVGFPTLSQSLRGFLKKNASRSTDHTILMHRSSSSLSHFTSESTAFKLSCTERERKMDPCNDRGKF